MYLSIAANNRIIEVWPMHHNSSTPAHQLPFYLVGTSTLHPAATLIAEPGWKIRFEEVEMGELTRHPENELELAA